eukprot:TRINITY_DN13096_c0_g1_i1.p1 TRINITY_DN13096_c0_g1~~TRINITY_DN13096_c0_g1_i1.p1  ORF type:complete len:138 (+),score=19.18 TRINITY_DN13096_c0_g1_i1:39-452(+)
MPRGGSRGRSSSPPPRSSFASSRPAPQTRPQQQAPTQQPQSGSMFGGIGSTIMTGMAFGAGSEVAHQAVRGIMGGGSHGQTQEQQPQQQQYQQQQQQNPCQVEIMNFSNCLQRNDDLSYCQNFSDMLKQCKQMNNLA